MTRLSPVTCYALAAAMLVALTGCGAPVKPNAMQYILGPIRPGAPAGEARDAVLEVRPFTIDAAFASKELIYRIGDATYEKDYYHLFLTSSSRMIRDVTRNWLVESNAFARVVDAGVYMDPLYALEANITKLYGDTRQRGVLTAVVEIRFFLVKSEGSRDPEVVFSRVYLATAEAPTLDPTGLVAGYNACLQTILSDLEEDVVTQK